MNTDTLRLLFFLGILLGIAAILYISKRNETKKQRDLRIENRNRKPRKMNQCALCEEPTVKGLKYELCYGCWDMYKNVQ